MIGEQKGTETRRYGEDRVGIFVVLVLNFLLAVGYGVVNPLFEAPDEHHHYFTAQWIAENGRLPSVPQPAEERFFVPERPSDWLGQEAAQPPLYYILAAFVVAPFDTADARDLTIHNPFVRLGDPGARVNINGFAHGHDGWPWRGHVLAVHVLRVLSAVMGTVTVWLIYKSGRLLWADRPQVALLAAGFVGFLPQFTFQFSAVSNDTLVTVLATWAIYQLLLVSGVRCQVSGRGVSGSTFQVSGFDSTGGEGAGLPTTHYPLSTTWWWWVLLGVTIGLTALTKTQGIVLLVFAVGFVIAKGVRCQVSGVRSDCPSLLSTLYFLLLIVLPALVLALPLWVRNWRLYGDFTAANQFVAIAGGDRGYTVWQALGEWEAIWFSFFANFGWFNVVLPEGVYWFWLGLVGCAVVGRVLDLTQRHRGTEIRKEGTEGTAGRTELGGQGGMGTELTTHHPPPTTHFLITMINFLASTPVLLFGWFLGVFVALMVFNMQTPAAQGRLLFPALLPIGLGVGYGLERFMYWVSGVRYQVSGVRLRPFILHSSYFILLIGMNLFCLFAVVRPAYALPEVVAAVPETATEFNAALENGLTLVAAEVVTERARPDEFVELMLYWRKEGVLEERPELVIELFGREQQLVGKVQSWHGRGLYPADFWPEGELIAERTFVQVDQFAADFSGLDYPTLAAINVKIAGDEAVQDIGRVDVEPLFYPALRSDPAAQFGEQIELRSVRVLGPRVAGEELLVWPTWQVRDSDVAENYAVFVQLGEQGVSPLAQGDGIPLDGMYPTTYWKAGQVFEDDFRVVIPTDLPSGEYPLYIGFYRPEPPFERLPVVFDGERVPFDAFLVETLEIEGVVGR